MPGLPDRPDLDQLRRQARELLRAAVGGDPAALARIRVISERITLSSAQQALAREYGFRNWPALRAEVERRRSPLERWSFGGADAIEILPGTLLLEGLVITADDALLFTSLVPADNGGWPDGESRPDRRRRLDEENRALDPSSGAGLIPVADDQGAAYALSLREWSSATGPTAQPIRYSLHPVPERGVQWIELHGRNGTTARLLRSPRATVRLGRLAPATDDPVGHARPGDARSARSHDEDLTDTADLTDRALLTDGARYHFDLGVTLPPLDGITVDIDSLLGTHRDWSLRLRATPRWWRYSDDGNRKWSPVQIRAEDDRGHSYPSNFGGSSARDGHEYVTLGFTPGLDPQARRLRLTCASSTERIPVDLALTPAP